MIRNKSHTNSSVQWVSRMVRVAWFALTAILVSPVFVGFDEMPEWIVVLPLLSILAALAGIIGFNPLHDMHMSSRGDEASDEQGSMVAGVH